MKGREGGRGVGWKVSTWAAPTRAAQSNQLYEEWMGKRVQLGGRHSVPRVGPARIAVTGSPRTMGGSSACIGSLSWSEPTATPTASAHQHNRAHIAKGRAEAKGLRHPDTKP